MFGRLKKAPLSGIAVIVSIIIGIITDRMSDDFSWLHVLGLVGFVALVFWIEVAQKNTPPDTTQLDKKNREILLRKIAYRSAAALPTADEHIDLAFAAAEKFLQPAIVQFVENRVERDLPKQPISRIFEENGQKLLVLGEPGSGKTTLLYQLALELTEVAQQDAEKPIPLIINLSSWPKRPTGASFEDWLLSEMQLGYDIPKQYGQKLLADRQVTFLLDGLDEVAESAREDCLDAIDRYFRNLMPVTVCCRTKEYELLRRKLHVEFAVRIKPLTAEQVAASLDALKLTRLADAWQRHEALREVLNTPLMVRVAATALADEALPEAELTDAASASKALWRAYARHALHAKKKAEETRQPTRYTDADTWRWMQWLARTLDERDLTNFFVERMQPDMLPENKMLFFRVLNGLAFGLVAGLAVSLALGLVFGMWWASVVGVAAVGLVLGLLLALFSPKNQMISSSITPIERSNFRWNPSGLINFFIVGLAIGLVFGLIGGLILDLIGGFPFGMAAGVAIGVVAGINAQFFSYSVKDEHRTQPNEGIYKSGQIALQFGSVGLSVILIGFIFQDVYVLQYALNDVISIYHLFYLVGGLMLFLLPYFNGGHAYSHHYILRFLLYRSGCIPYRYVRFLDFAGRLGFLRRVGGGYTFYHRELRDFIVQEEKMP